MLMEPAGPDIGKSALVIVDMQNDFVHPNGGFAQLARERPEAKIDMPFLMSTIPRVKRLAGAFRRPAGGVRHPGTETAAPSLSRVPGVHRSSTS
jgi:nicotinamidase-related amidase